MATAPSEPDALALAADFAPATREEWHTLVGRVLARSTSAPVGDPEQALSTLTYDGIEIKPLYTAADSHGVTSDARRAATSEWLVCTRYDDPDPGRANRAVLDDLERGTTMLWLALGGTGPDVATLDAVLEGVYLDLVAITLDAGARTVSAASSLLALAERRGVDPSSLTGSFGADPIGARARTAADTDLEMITRLVASRAAAPGMRIATVDATVYHDAGASDAQELGMATSVGVAYLRALTAGGLDLADAFDALEFRWAVTAEQFPSIAKLRAARVIWARVAQLCEVAGVTQRQHAVTSAAMMTQRDPWANMLRTTIGCFAAAVGGADAITVAPFDAAIGEPDELARRVARNTHAILHDESSLARVRDAAGGSWYVESSTDDLADAAWDVFTEIERGGGALTALNHELIDTMIDRTARARADDVARRRVPIIGVSEFAFLDEEPVRRSPRPEEPVGPLPPERWAAPFEALRDRADATAPRPTVFLAALGPPAQHAARVAFARNLFAAGGVASVVGSSSEEFGTSGATVACLCGADEAYEQDADPTAAALREAGAAQVWLAGRFATDAVDGNLYDGVDVLVVLESVLGVSA